MTSQTSIKLFGIYSLVIGLTLLLFPMLLPVFGFTASDEDAWIRLLGFVLCCSSYYYLRSAFANNPDFVLYTIHTRFMAPVVVSFLILSGKADWHFLPFGIIDGLGGLWTYLLLKKEVKRNA